MASLGRSRSSFARRKTTQELTHDIKESEEEYLIGRTSENEQTSRSRSKSRNLASALRGRSRSRTRRKSVDELIDEVRQTERQYVKDQQAVTEKSNSLLSKLRSRSRSPFSRRKSAKDHIEDVRAKEKQYTMIEDAGMDQKQTNDSSAVRNKGQRRSRSPLPGPKSTEEIIREVKERENLYMKEMNNQQARNKKSRETSGRMEEINPMFKEKGLKVGRSCSSRNPSWREGNPNDSVTLKVEKPKKRAFSLQRVQCGKHLDKSEQAFEDQFRIEVFNDRSSHLPSSSAQATPPWGNRGSRSSVDQFFKDLETPNPSTPPRNGRSGLSSSLGGTDPKFRQSSLTQESLHDVHDVLRKMDRKLEEGIKSGTPVSRATVRDALLSVVDTLEDTRSLESVPSKNKAAQSVWSSRSVLSDERSSFFPTGESTEESRLLSLGDSTAEDYTVGDTVDGTVSDDGYTNYSEETEATRKDLFSEALDLIAGDVFSSGETARGRETSNAQGPRRVSKETKTSKDMKLSEGTSRKPGRKTREREQQSTHSEETDYFRWNEDELFQAREALKEMLSFGATQPVSRSQSHAAVKSSHSAVTVKKSRRKSAEKWEDDDGTAPMSRTPSPIKRSPSRSRSRQRQNKTRPSGS